LSLTFQESFLLQMSPKTIWRVAPDALYFWHQVERQFYSGCGVRCCLRRKDDFVPDTVPSHTRTLAYATINGDVRVCKGNTEIHLFEG
jgi:hypothetical protein